MSDTLILNGDASPISLIPLSVVPWTEAIKLIYLNKCNVLNHYEDWEVSSPSQSLMVPSVLIMKEFYYKTKGINFNRLNLLYRDDFTCQYCGKKFPEKHLTMDHVIPKRDGGRKNWNNIVICCKVCNQKKGHDYIQPIKKPHKPTYFELLNNRRKYPINIVDPIWNEYIMWDEKLVRIKKTQSKYNFVQLME